MTPTSTPPTPHALHGALRDACAEALGSIGPDAVIPEPHIGRLRAVLADPAVRRSLAGVGPREVFGPWGSLPEHVATGLRAVVADDIRARMDLHPRGPLWVGVARALNTTASTRRLPQAVRGAAGAWAARVWKRPALARASLERARRVRRFERAHAPVLADLVAALGQEPDWLCRDFAEGVPVDHRCRGFWHDPRRNVVFGYLLGIDLVDTGDGVVCHESNLNAGLIGQVRRPYFEVDPIPPGLAELAASLGMRRVVWMGADLAPLESWLHELLLDELGRRGIALTVVEDPRLPARPTRPGVPPPVRGIFPPAVERDSLVVRLRSYRTPSDRLVSGKEAVAACLRAELERSGAQDVLVLPLAPEPGPVSPPSDPGLPNLVYKYPATDRGEGVYMLRARSREHALELAREIDARTGEREGRFQPWVHAPLGPDRTLSEHRAVVVVSPVAVRCLGARRRGNRHPLPVELPDGIVEDRRPFISTGFFGNVSGPRIPQEEAVAEQAAERVGEHMAAYLRRTLVWREEAGDP